MRVCAPARAASTANRMAESTTPPSGVSRRIVRSPGWTTRRFGRRRRGRRGSGRVRGAGRLRAGACAAPAGAAFPRGRGGRRRVHRRGKHDAHDGGLGGLGEPLDRTEADAGGAGVALLLGGVGGPRARLQQAHGGTSGVRRGQVGRSLPATGGGVTEPGLGDAVLAGVVREHRAPPAGREHVDRLVQGAGEDVELLVHRDADGLERALGGVAAGATGRRRGWRRGRARRARRWWSPAGGPRSTWRCGWRSARRRTCAAGGRGRVRRCRSPRPPRCEHATGPCACPGARRGGS